MKKSKELITAEKNLNDFLEKYPHMNEEQKKINRILNRAGSQDNRCLIITEMLMENLDKLADEFNKLEELNTDLANTWRSK